MINYYTMQSAIEVFEESKKQAEEDLKKGILKRRTFGLIRRPELLEQAYKEKGVEVEIIAGDIVDTIICSDAEGYNGIMDPEIKKRLGENVYDEIRQRYRELCVEL